MSPRSGGALFHEGGSESQGVLVRLDRGVIQFDWALRYFERIKGFERFEWGRGVCVGVN